MTLPFPGYTVTSGSTQADYAANIFILAAGDVFHYDNSLVYETILQRLIEYLPNTLHTFVVGYAPPGSEYYEKYGPNTIAVISVT